jgi:hypothetical protein
MATSSRPTGKFLSESRSEVKEALERAKKVPLGQQSEYITIGLFHGIQEEVRDIINTNNVGRYLKDPLYVEACVPFPLQLVHFLLFGDFKASDTTTVSECDD